MHFKSLAVLALLGLTAIPAVGQGIRQPLTIQGLEQSSITGSRARALGGATSTLSGDIAAMFANPAGLANVSQIGFSVGVGTARTEFVEAQRWNPNRYYASLSLNFQNEAEYANDPLDSPDWELSESATRINHAAGVMPLELGGMQAAFSLGYREVTDLTGFDRNENVLDPYIGNFRPEPTPRPNPGDSVTVAWSSFERQRSGSIHGFAAGFALAPRPWARIGLKAELWSGSSDDAQSDSQRGVFSLYDSAHLFTYYPDAQQTSWTGTSDYSALGLSGGLQIVQERFDLGLEVTLPVEVTRDWERSGGSASGSDTVTLPASWRLGVQLRPSDRVRVVIDYRIQNLSEMEAETDDPAGTPAWEDVNALHAGAEYQFRPAIALRAGYRQLSTPYVVQGSGIVEEQGRGSIYSAGAGWARGEISVDFAYEYHRLLFTDRWASNVNYQLTTGHTALLTIGYRL